MLAASPDIAIVGSTSATLLARKWESAILVNVDSETLRKIMNSPDARQRRRRTSGVSVHSATIIFETVAIKSDAARKVKKEERDTRRHHSGPSEKKELDGGGGRSTSPSEADSGEAGRLPPASLHS